MVQTMGIMFHSLWGSTRMWEYYHVGAYSPRPFPIFIFYVGAY